MPSSSNRRERPQIKSKADMANNGALSAADSLRFHWPEYLMEAGEGAFTCSPRAQWPRCYGIRFSGPAIPAERCRSPDADGLGDGRDNRRDRPLTVGQAVGSTLQSRGHIHVSPIGESGFVGYAVLLRRTVSRPPWRG
jgi:hypothetical protein